MPLIPYKIKRRIIHAFRSHSSPHEIALGVAAGVFIAIMPVYGLHTVLVLLTFFIVRRINLIAMFIGTNISLPPTFPFITWAGYSIGRFMLGSSYPALNWSNFKKFTLHDVAGLYLPLFLGSIVLGIICAALFYFLTFRLARRRHARRLARKGAGRA